VLKDVGDADIQPGTLTVIGRFTISGDWLLDRQGTAGPGMVVYNGADGFQDALHPTRQVVFVSAATS
jgi:hypothetical protein